MGFDEGKVVFDHPDRIYFAGQVVKGLLKFQQTKDKSFRGIKLKAKGFCKTRIMKRHTRGTKTHYKAHEAYESYFDRVVYLMGSEHGECLIKPGSYSFPFEVLIPPHVPSSYEGEHGHIRYTIKLVVDRAYKIDQEKKFTITVVAPYDLNTNPYCGEPMVFNFNEPYSCCCTSQGRIETTAKVCKSGFCAGETIPIELRCANESKLCVHIIKFEVKERVTFHATDATKHESRTIATLKKGPVTSGTSRNWELEMVLPPPMEVYNVEECQYIDINYDFEVEIAPEGCYSSTEATKSIILGHIPLRMPGVENNPVMQTIPYPNLAPYPVGNQPYGGENSTYLHPDGNTDNPLHPGGDNANEKSLFLPVNPAYPEKTPYPTENTEKSPYVSSSPYPRDNKNPTSPPPYNQTTPYPTLPHLTTPGMPMPGHGSSNMPMPGHGSSNMPIPGHGSSNMPIPGHGYSNMPMPGHGSSNMPMPGHSSSNIPMPGHGSSNMPMPGHGSSNMPMPGHGSSNMPMPGHSSSNMPIPGHGSSNMPIPGHGSSNMPMPGHDSSNMPMPGHGQGSSGSRPVKPGSLFPAPWTYSEIFPESAPSAPEPTTPIV